MSYFGRFQFFRALVKCGTTAYKRRWNGAVRVMARLWQGEARRGFDACNINFRSRLRHRLLRLLSRRSHSELAKQVLSFQSIFVYFWMAVLHTTLGHISSAI